MAIEAGGKNGVIPADDITTAYVDTRNAGNKPYEIFAADLNVGPPFIPYYLYCGVPSALPCHEELNSPELLCGTDANKNSMVTTTFPAAVLHRLRQPVQVTNIQLVECWSHIYADNRIVTRMSANNNLIARVDCLLC